MIRRIERDQSDNAENSKWWLDSESKREQTVVRNNRILWSSKLSERTKNGVVTVGTKVARNLLQWVACILVVLHLKSVPMTAILFKVKISWPVFWSLFQMWYIYGYVSLEFGQNRSCLPLAWFTVLRILRMLFSFCYTGIFACSGLNSASF